MRRCSTIRVASLPASTLDDLMSSLALESFTDRQRTRYGLVVRRADLRTFPTLMRVFNSRDNTDIDRFQESALFPGTPVAIVHESRDGQWWFVVSPLYAAWVEKQFIAEGSAQQVFDYARKTPYLVVTGANRRRRSSRQRSPTYPSCSSTWACAFPCWRIGPRTGPVNGQHPYTAHVIELPDARERRLAALHARAAAEDRGHVERLPAAESREPAEQGFKFLGERYGWGHSYNARDCSGFVSEVYRSFGVQLPRNTRDQAVSPALNRIVFTEADDHERAPGGAARPASRRSHLYSRARHDGDRPRPRHALRHSRHDRHQLPRQ